MAILNLDHWYLRKHESNEVFGPVSFAKIQEWSRSAQISPQDLVSEDNRSWTKAPMLPELQMDWLIEVEKDFLYGPTSSEAVLEFYRNKEITPETFLINCCSGEQVALKDCAFFVPEPEEETAQQAPVVQPVKGAIRINLQKRVRELEASLLDKRRQVLLAEETIHKLQDRVRFLEERVRELTGFHSSSK